MEIIEANKHIIFVIKNDNLIWIKTLLIILIKLTLDIASIDELSKLFTFSLATSMNLYF